MPIHQCCSEHGRQPNCFKIRNNSVHPVILSHVPFVCTWMGALTPTMCCPSHEDTGEAEKSLEFSIQELPALLTLLQNCSCSLPHRIIPILGEQLLPFPHNLFFAFPKDEDCCILQSFSQTFSSTGPLICSYIFELISCLGSSSCKTVQMHCAM